MLAFADIRSMVVWKYHPESQTRSGEVTTDSRELLDALKETYDSSDKAQYGDLVDSFSPRYFIRFLGSAGLMTAGEVLRNYAFLGNEWLYTPRSRVWSVLEKIVRDN
jgi:hypothetical protein